MTSTDSTQADKTDRVRDIFKGLENGDGAAFFTHVADDVDWTVMGTHPLAGHYPSKAAFVAGTFAKLAKVLPEGAQLHVENVVVQDDVAVVELHSLATAKDGMRSDYRYCWASISRTGSSIASAPIWTPPWWRACSNRTRSESDDPS